MKFEYKDATFEEVAKGLGEILPRSYTRYQMVYSGGELIAVVFWCGNEPHVEYITTSARTIYVVTCDFVSKHDCVIASLANTKNLFDRACERTRLKKIGFRLDKFGRGVEHLYGASYV